jgi:hypothetical protein
VTRLEIWRFRLACWLHDLADRLEHTDTVRVERHTYEEYGDVWLHHGGSR